MECTPFSVLTSCLETTMDMVYICPLIIYRFCLCSKCIPLIFDSSFDYPPSEQKKPLSLTFSFIEIENSSYPDIIELILIYFCFILHCTHMILNY